MRIPDNFPVRPLKPGEPAKDRATCGACGRSWDDGISTEYTPAPAGRCPFEAFHKAPRALERIPSKHRATNPRPSYAGRLLKCHETGAEFIGARDGITTNYATDGDGWIYSDAGVDARERRALLDRSKPFVAYISSDGKSVTGWKGNKLGDVIASHRIRTGRRSWVHGSHMLAIRVRDVHGGLWYGRGSPDIAVTLRAAKGG